MDLEKEQTYGIVIGLGANGLANVRALAQHGVPVIIFLSRGQSNEVYAATRYGRKDIVEVTDGTAILQRLQSLPKEKTYILFPTTDYQVEYLSIHRDRLSANCLLQFPDKSVVETLLHKDLFDTFCRSHNFPVPQVALIHNRDEIQQACQKMAFPIMAKTLVKSYKPGLQKAYILSDREELLTWYESIQTIHEEFMLQEFIPGTDHSVFFTMQYISSTGRLLASFTGRKIRQWRPLSGGTASAEPAYNEYLTNLTYEFFRKAGFWGIGSMEYKQNEETGKFSMIEPTVCRTDFQEGVAIANGVNIPLIAYQDKSGQTVQPVFQKKDARKAWMHILNDRLSRDWYISRQELGYFDWIRSLRHVRSFDALSFRDPGPLVAAFQNKVTNRVRRFFSK